MHTAVRLLVVASVFVTAAVACEFRYDPASVPQFYRQEGWFLPSIHDDNPHVKANTYGTPPLSDVLTAVPGAKAFLLRRDEDHYVISFPEQVFSLGNQRKRMHSVLAKATIIRWEINGKVVAYSYGLIPITKAYKKHGKWYTKVRSAAYFTGRSLTTKAMASFGC